MRTPLRAGVTLIELIVALAIVGFLFAVVGVGARNVRPSPRSSAFAASIAAARDSAVSSAHPVSMVIVTEEGQPALITAFPDGTVRSTVATVDPLDGTITRVMP